MESREPKLVTGGLFILGGTFLATVLGSVVHSSSKNEALLRRIVEEEEKKGALVHRRTRRRRRIPHYAENVVPHYEDSSFQSHFRMEKATFEYLLTMIHLLVPVRIHSARAKLLQFLWVVGNTETFRSVADRFSVCKGSLHRHVQQIASALLELRRQCVKFPTTDAEVVKSAKCFAFPGAIGCIDGTYIPMLGKTGDQRDAYICRKGFPAMHLQVVCDSRLTILDAVTGYPGSVHDARVYRNSPLYLALKLIPKDYHLLGDSAYPLDSFLLTKYKENGELTRSMKKYNKFHASERSCVERCIGLLKGKFRRLRHFDARNDNYLCKAIIACIVVHNIILKKEGVVEGDIETDVLGDQNDVDVEESTLQLSSKAYARKKMADVCLMLT